MKDYVRTLIDEFHGELTAKQDFLLNLRARIFEKVRVKFYPKTKFGSTSHADCLFLYLLVRKYKPAVVFEIGTHVGTSACFMAEALRENGSGKVITCDKQENDVRCYPDEYAELIEYHNGYSTEVLENSPCTAGMMFIDGAVKEADIPALTRSLAPNFVVALHDSKADQPDDKGNRNIALLKPRLQGRWLQAPASTDSLLIHRNFHVNLGTSLCLGTSCP